MTSTSERQSLVLAILEENGSNLYDPTTYIFGKAMFAKGFSFGNANSSKEVMMKIFSGLCTDAERSGNRFRLIELYESMPSNDSMGLFAKYLPLPLFETLANYDYTNENVKSLFAGIV